MTSLPFSYNYLIRKIFESGKYKTILDLGCGQGTLGKSINLNSKFEMTGVDIYKPYLKECLDSGKYKAVKQADLTKKMSYKKKSYDVVSCMETIEHLKKRDGERLLDQLDNIAKKMVILSCPVGVAAQESYEGNVYQKHLSSWWPREFRKRGYKVYGIGLKAVYGYDTHVNQRISFLRWPLYFISFLMNPVANFYPDIACQMIAVRTLKS